MGKSSITIKWNDDWENEIEKMAKKAIQDKLQPVLDDLRQQGEQGLSVPAMKSALSAKWSQAVGGSITDPELTTYATALANGQRIVLQ